MIFLSSLIETVILENDHQNYNRRKQIDRWYSRLALGTARRRQLQHLRHVRVDQEEGVLVDGALPHQYQVDARDRVEAALGDFALVATDARTRVVL